MKIDSKTLPKRNWLTSQELIAMYGVVVGYSQASRAAQRLVRDYNIPWYRDGRKWREIATEQIGDKGEQQ